MAKARPSDKFHVGQHLVTVFVPGSGWENIDGMPCVVTAPKRRMDVWCTDSDGVSNRNLKRNQWRYEVLLDGDEVSIRESQLRLPYEGAALSTWEPFAEATGIDLTPRSRRGQQFRALAREFKGFDKSARG